jgi:hypothetical protein
MLPGLGGEKLTVRPFVFNKFPGLGAFSDCGKKSGCDSYNLSPCIISEHRVCHQPASFTGATGLALHPNILG